MLELARIDQAKDPAKGVVRGNAVLQTKIAPEPIQLLVGPQFDLFKGVGSYQNPVDRHYQQLHKIVLDLARLPGIVNRHKNVGQAQRLFGFHQHLLETEQPTKITCRSI